MTLLAYHLVGSFDRSLDQFALNSLKLDQTLKAFVDQLALEFDRSRHLAILAPNFRAVEMVRSSIWLQSLGGARLFLGR